MRPANTVEPDLFEVESWLSADSLVKRTALHEIGIYLMRDFMFYRESEIVAVPGLGSVFPHDVRGFFQRHGMGEPFLPEHSPRFPRIRPRKPGKSRGVVDGLIARHRKWGPWCYWLNPKLPYDKAVPFEEYTKFRGRR